MDKILVQVRFSEIVKVKGMILEFNDALYFSPEEYANLQPEVLALKKAERIANWKNAIENPIPKIEPTSEQLQQELQGIKDNEVNVSDRKKEILTILGSTELEALQSEMRDIEAKFNVVKEKLDAADPTAVPLEAVAVILDNQKKDVDGRIAKKEGAQ